MTKLKRQKDEISNEANKELTEKRFKLRFDEDKLECNLQHKRGLLEQDEFKLSNDKKKIKVVDENIKNQG